MNNTKLFFKRLRGFSIVGDGIALCSALRNDLKFRPNVTEDRLDSGKEKKKDVDWLIRTTSNPVKRFAY